MATFGRRLSRLRQRAAAVATTPVEVQRTAATAAALPILSRLRALTQGLKGEEITQPIISPRQAVSLVSTGVPPSRTDMRCKAPYVWNHKTQSCVLPRPGTAINGAGFTKVPTVIANGMKKYEALPSQPGIGPAREGDSFWRQLMTTGLEKIMGPATTPTRPPPQPGVTSDDYALAPPANGMPGWLIPAALIGGFLLLRR